jgi:hypothetical protein
MTTLNYQVAASADDGYFSSDGTFDNSDLVLFAGWYNDGPFSLHFFTRFAGVTIPAGATITAAYISTYDYNIFGTPAACTLSFEKAADPAAPTTYADINGRTLTTNNISWAPPSSGDWSNSGDISAIIQELVGAYDYSAGKHMMLIIRGPATGTENNFGYIQSFNYNGTTGVKLHIEYTVAAGIVIPVLEAQYRRKRS